MNATEIKDALPDNFAELKVDELREFATACGLDVPSRAPKATLVEALTEYRARVGEKVDGALDATEPEEVEAEVVAETDEPVDEETAAEESKVIALREETPAELPALLPTTAEFDAMMTIAGRIASTQMVPVAYRGKPDDVLAAILTGREMGLGPMQSLRDIYVVDGKPSLSANLLLARMREGGVVLVESESTAERARIKARRRDTGEVAEVEWTIEEAAKIVTRGKKLVDKDNWTNYPADMLWARAVGRLARRLGPDLIGAAMPYTSEEVQDWDDAPASADAGEQRPHGDDRRTGQWVGPKDWRELFARIVHQLGAEETAAWMEELATVAYAAPKIVSVVNDPELGGDKKRDLWQRMGVVLRGLEDADRPVDGAGLQLTPGVRKIVASIIYEAFGKAVVLTGPRWALDPAEAELGQPSKESVLGSSPDRSSGAETDGRDEPAPETSEAASAPEDAPEAAPDDLRDADGNEIRF